MIYATKIRFRSASNLQIKSVQLSLGHGTWSKIHRDKHFGLRPSIQRKWQFSNPAVSPSIGNFSQFQHCDRSIRTSPFYLHLKAFIWSERYLACPHGGKSDSSITSRYPCRRVVFLVLLVRVTCFLNDHWKTEVLQQKPFKKEQRWRSYCMNVATQDHLASKTFYCFETVHKS